MYPFQQNRFPEILYEFSAHPNKTPQPFLVAKLGWQVQVAGFAIAHADIVDGFQLSEVTNQNDRDVTESAIASPRIQAQFGKVAAPTLFRPQVHTSKEASADERDFIHNEQYHVCPLPFELACLVTFQLFLEVAPGMSWKLWQAVRAPKPMLNAATPVYAVSSTVASTYSSWNKTS